MMQYLKGYKHRIDAACAFIIMLFAWFGLYGFVIILFGRSDQAGILIAAAILYLLLMIPKWIE